MNLQIFHKPVKMILMIAVFLIIQNVANCALVENYTNECRDAKDNLICLIPGCINTAAELINSMDESVDPCFDFYKFVCGKYQQNKIASNGERYISKAKEIEDLLYFQLRSIVEKPSQSNELRPFALLKQFYRVCLNNDVIEDEIALYANHIFKQYGGIPFVEGDAWKETNFDWKEVIYKYRDEGLDFEEFISVFVKDDPNNATRRLINIAEPVLLLSREYAMLGGENEFVESYTQYLALIAMKMGANEITAINDSLDLIDFCIKLASITTPSEEIDQKNISNNRMTIEELINIIPEFPWLEYLNNIIAIPGVNVTKDEIVSISHLSYYSKFLELMKRTPKRVQSNYVASIMFNIVLDKLSSKTTQGDDFKQKGCLKEANKGLNFALSSLFVREHFVEESKKSVEEIVTYLKTAFVNIFQQSMWMDDNTKSIAIDKLKSMVVQVGYPDELLDNKTLENFYMDLEPSEDYFRFSLNLNKFLTTHSFKTLKEVVNKTHWTKQTYTTSVNAYYSKTTNVITIPAGILQGRHVFSKDRPQYMNYGSIGSVIGHEITHGFDDTGRHFNKKGEFENWWSEETSKIFLEKQQCFMEQYINFLLPHNFTQTIIKTIGEIISDNGGSKAAYLAYQKWVTSHQEEPRLPGLKYTPNQLFWISYANFWCEKHTEESLAELINFGKHLPQYIRLKGVLSNSPNFSKDFNCPLKSKMNPEKKCSIWQLM